MIHGGTSIREIITLVLKNTQHDDTIEYQLLSSRWPLLPHVNDYLRTHALPSQVSLKVDKELIPTTDNPHRSGALILSTSEFYQFVGITLSYMEAIRASNVNFESAIGGSESSTKNFIYDEVEIKETEDSLVLQIGVSGRHLPFIRMCDIYSLQMTTRPVIPYGTCIPPYSRQLEVTEKVYNVYLVFTQGTIRVMYLLAKFLFDPTQIMNKYPSKEVELPVERERQNITTSSEVHQLIESIYRDLKGVKYYNQPRESLFQFNRRQIELIQQLGGKFTMTTEVL